MNAGQLNLESVAHRQLQTWYAKLSHLESAGADIDSAEVDEEERRFWQAVRMHPELRQVMAQASEFPVSYWEDRYDREGLGSPVLHVVVHAAVKGMAQEDPECRPAMRSLLERAQGHQADEEAARHVCEHALAMVLME